MKKSQTHIQLAEKGPHSQIRVAVESAVTSEADRADWALRGLGRLIERAETDGKTKAAESATEHLAESAIHLEQWRAAEQEMQACGSEDKPIVEAVIEAAKSLRKLLPDAFPSLVDAQVFAAKLSLSDARHEAGQILRRRELADRQRKESRKSFWQAVEAGSHLVSPHGSGTDRALDVCIETGRYT